jgi:hypothetical protein
MRPCAVRFSPATQQVTFSYAGVAHEVTIAGERLGALLVSYCIKARIPLPRYSDKAVRVGAGTIIIICTSQYNASPDSVTAFRRLLFAWASLSSAQEDEPWRMIARQACQAVAIAGGGRGGEVTFSAKSAEPTSIRCVVAKLEKRRPPLHSCYEAGRQAKGCVGDWVAMHRRCECLTRFGGVVSGTPPINLF